MRYPAAHGAPLHHPLRGHDLRQGDGESGHPKNPAHSEHLYRKGGRVLRKNILWHDFYPLVLTPPPPPPMKRLDLESQAAASLSSSWHVISEKRLLVGFHIVFLGVFH